MVATVGCLAPLLALPSATAALSATPSPSVAAAAPLVDARTATLTQHPTGLPQAGSALARRISTAKVTQDLVHDRLKATITLRAIPTSATNARLHVEFGNVDAADVCQGDPDGSLATSTYSGLSAGFTRRGRVVTLNKAVSEAGYMDWDCAFVATTVPDSTDTYDGVAGDLKDVLAKPSLRISTAELLGKKVDRRLGLVRHVWTTLEVAVKNSGRADAPATRVTGSGKGLKVRTDKVGTVWAGDSRTARLKVKLTGKHRTKLKLVARSGRVTVGRTIVVKPVPAPRRPVAGKYRSKDGNVTFRVKRGRIAGFRAFVWTTCGGYPDVPTHSMNYYDFPRTAIARNGLVDRIVRKRLFTTHLQLKAAGTTVKRGSFAYYGPDRCRATLSFRARRVGK